MTPMSTILVEAARTLHDAKDKSRDARDRLNREMELRYGVVAMRRTVNVFWNHIGAENQYGNANEARVLALCLVAAILNDAPKRLNPKGEVK